MDCKAKGLLLAIAMYVIGLIIGSSVQYDICQKNMIVEKEVKNGRK